MAWEFIWNPFEDSPFLTSDFPVAIAPERSERALRRFVPLRPDLGAFVSPSRVASDNRPTEFTNFTSRVRTAKRPEVHALNRLIVQCAEDMVFASTNGPWINRLVQRNAKVSLVHATGRKKIGNGYYTFTSLGIGEKTT